MAASVLLMSGNALGQGAGSVTGRISIVEAPGFKTPDLANAVIWLEGGGGGRGRSAPQPTAQILMESRQFVPRVRVVSAGTSVAFPNQDPFRHNVFSKSGPGSFDLGLYARGETRSARFDSPGVYPIFCNIHARMVSFVVAVGSPHVTQPASDGTFNIEGVAPGSYVLHVWHDRGGARQQALTVLPSGTGAMAVELNARSWRFVQHLNKFGQKYPPDGRDRY
ncbi:MAG: methylamine utilization protein [Gemmatimonadota bacterium]